MLLAKEFFSYISRNLYKWFSRQILPNKIENRILLLVQAINLEELHWYFYYNQDIFLQLYFISSRKIKWTLDYKE